MGRCLRGRIGKYVGGYVQTQRIIFKNQSLGKLAVGGMLDFKSYIHLCLLTPYLNCSVTYILKLTYHLEEYGVTNFLQCLDKWSGHQHFIAVAAQLYKNRQPNLS